MKTADEILKRLAGYLNRIPDSEHEEEFDLPPGHHVPGDQADRGDRNLMIDVQQVASAHDALPLHPIEGQVSDYQISGSCHWVHVGRCPPEERNSFAA
ncbi:MULTISPECIES: hypothetical protein [unclassified Streptomyces]|uniref:hypothetical protein n=1 Tax=unclassified Streptomyces TaxID=2593676 RepID=UPI0036E2E677